MRAIFRGVFDTFAATWNFYVQAGPRQGVDAGGAAQFCGWGALAPPNVIVGIVLPRPLCRVAEHVSVLRAYCDQSTDNVQKSCLRSGARMQLRHGRSIDLYFKKYMYILSACG